MHKRTDINLKALKKSLLEERHIIEHDVELSEESRQTVVLDQTSVGRLSRMDALQGQAMALETERRREVELARIDAALARMKDGEYGFCINCDENISAKRLENDPAVPNCIECARSAGNATGNNH